MRTRVAFLVFAASCTNRGLSTELAIPEVEGAVSYVVSADSGDGLIGVRADRIDRAVWVDELRARTTIHLLLYGRPLETMGVEPGPVAPAVGCARPCDLLSPLRSLEVTVETDGRAPGWVERSQVPEPLATALVGPDRCGRRACLQHLIDDVEAPDAVRMRWAAPEGPETVLVGSHDGALFRLALEGDLERVCLAIGESVTAAARAGESESDRLWVAGLGWAGMVEISAATSTAACRVSPRVTLPGGGEAVAIAGSAPEEGGEVFVLTNDDAAEPTEALLFRWQGGSIEEIARRPLHSRDLETPRRGMRHGAVARSAPGRALAVFASDELLWFDEAGGGTRIETFPIDARLMSVAISEPFGIVAAEENRFLLWRGAGLVASREPGGTWEPLGPPPGGGKPLIVLPHGRRITLTWEGSTADYLGGAGYCPPELLPLGVGSYSPAGGALFGASSSFVIARLPDRLPTFNHVLRVRAPPAECGDEND